MDTDLTGVVSGILSEAAADLKLFFGNLVRTERAKESGAYADNPEEAAQQEAEISATDVNISVSGTTVSVEIITSGSEYDRIMTEGKSVAYSGGSEGTVTHPDGSTSKSKVPKWLWGQPVQDSAEPASPWRQNATKMIQTLLPGQITDYVKSRLGDKIAPLIAQYMGAQLAGGVA